MNRYGFTLMAVLILCLHTPAIASLDFDTHRIRYVASIIDEKAEAAFTFTNTGDQPVTITTVRTSCGCTTATLDKMIYAPGGTGQVTVDFAFGDRTGKQHKRITVRTSTPGEDGEPVIQDTALYFRVTIPQPVKLRPRMLIWQPGEELRPKTIQVSINHDAPIELGQPQVEGQLVTAELKEVEPGKRYELILTPNQGAQHSTPATQEAIIGAKATTSELDQAARTPAAPQQHGKVKLNVTFGEDVSRTYSVLARVMQPKPQPAALSPSESELTQASSTHASDSADTQVASIGVDEPSVAAETAPAP